MNTTKKNPPPDRIVDLHTAMSKTRDGLPINVTTFHGCSNVLVTNHSMKSKNRLEIRARLPNSGFHFFLRKTLFDIMKSCSGRIDLRFLRVAPSVCFISQNEKESFLTKERYLSLSQALSFELFKIHAV